MIDYTKGETAGGWIHVLGNGNPVGLIHPKHVNKFLAVDDLYEACLIAINEIERLAMVTGYVGEAHYPRIAQIKQALAKAKVK